MITSEYILELSNVFHSGQVSEFVLSAYNVMYRVTMVVVHLGWVDLNSGYSTLLFGSR